MPIEYVIISTICFAIVWAIPVTVVGMRMRRNKVPKKNFLILINVLFWMSFILCAIAQIQYMAGLNQTLADPNLRAQWMAFMWPMGFASSFGGFFVTNDRREHIISALKLLLSFIVLLVQVVSLMS